jgi:Replication regulatory protein RepB.
MDEKKRVGRPKKQGAKTDAEASKDYRQRLKSQRRQAVNIYLSANAKDLLDRICRARSMTMASVVEWALEQAVRLDSIEQANGSSCLPWRYQKEIREKLVDARNAAGLGECEMAERIRAPQNRYRKWEAGLEKVPEKYLRAVVETLHLPANFFKDDEQI